jgi:hypothetical protein
VIAQLFLPAGDVDLLRRLAARAGIELTAEIVPIVCASTTTGIRMAIMVDIETTGLDAREVEELRRLFAEVLSHSDDPEAAWRPMCRALSIIESGKAIAARRGER